MMPHLTHTQRQAFNTYTALYKERGIPKPLADKLFLRATGYPQVPYFMDLSEEECEWVMKILNHKNLTLIAAQMGGETGVCALCGRELTDPESVERGIGPVCYGKLSRPHSVKDLLEL